MSVLKVTNAKLKGDVKGPTFTGAVDGATFTGDVTYDETTPPVEPPPSGNYDNAETDALAASIVPAPPATWLEPVDTLISSLKASGVWAKTILFYGFAAPNLDACLWNWKNTSVGRLTAAGTLTLTPNTALESDGKTGVLTSSFAVNTGGAANGNAHFGYFCLSEAAAENISPFQTSAGRHYLGVQSSSSAITKTVCGLNTSNAGAYSTIYGSAIGHWVLQQNTATQLELFLDGVSAGTSAQTNSADTGTVQFFKTGAGHYTTRKTAFVHYGSKLTAPEQLALSKALYTFLAAVGVRPKAGSPGANTGPTNVAPYKHLPMGANLYYPINSYLPRCEMQGRAGAYPYAMIKVTDPNYVNLFRLETHPGDRASWDSNAGLQRVQLDSQGSRTFVMGATIDTTFSLFVEQGSRNGFSNWCTVSDAHDQPIPGGESSSVPSCSLNPSNGDFYFMTLDNTTSNHVWHKSTSRPCPQGAWHHIRLVFKTGNASTGWIKGWFDGQQIWDFKGVCGNPAGSPFWWNMALYGGNNNPGSFAVWFANWETDYSGSQPFADRVGNPLPCPPLT